MRRLFGIALIVLFSSSAFAAAELKTEEQKTFYSLGYLIGSRSLSTFDLTPSELTLVEQGLKDAIVTKKPLVDPSPYMDKLQSLADTRRKAQGEKQAEEGKVFLAKQAKEPGALQTPSGMVYFILKQGTGASPKATDVVKVNYRGTLPDGTEFDSSYKRGTPIEFPLNGVIPCWTEGVQLMKVGGKAKLVCPSALAYGEKGAGNMIPPGATLVFEVELIDVKPPAAAGSSTPKDSAPATKGAPPKSSK